MRIRKLIFGISPEETTFAQRGFQGAGGLRQRLEEIGRTFVGGYHAGLEENSLEGLILKLDSVSDEFRGFAYEGAAMALALLDRVTPWRGNRWETFLAGPGEPHTYMLHVGLGWVFARLPMFDSTRRRIFNSLDPLLRWLAIDGYGFHEGFFHAMNRPRPSSSYTSRAFDQGFGRSLWFSQCGEPERISKMIVAFELHRQSDLWSGVGLACGYAGELQEDGLQSLLRASGEFYPALAQGIAFAAKARQRAGNLMPFTELACQTICGMSAREAAHLTDQALENLPQSDPETPYEVWRCRIQEQFTRQEEMKR
jgi:hypothetical protein